MATEPLVRPEYGPSLPALLEQRARVPRRLTMAVAAGVLVIAAAAVAVLTVHGEDKRYVHRSDPVFNLRYAEGALQRSSPPGWALMLSSRRGGKFVQSFSVKGLTLPPHKGGASGYLPVYADAYERRIAKTLPGFMAVEEGKARINESPGYQITYTIRPNGRTIFGRDVVVVPQDVPGQRQAAVLRLLQTHAAGVHAAADVGTAGAIKKPYRSFRFGTDVKGTLLNP
jgi:hypothetical protein